MIPTLGVISNGASALLNLVFLGVARAIFYAISGIYALFYGLATTRLFTNDTIQSVSNNVYILVSVVILFAFSVKLIEAIVNPDLLTDAKKGVTGVLKRTIIGLLLIVAIPSIFNFVYYLQAEIIVGGVVEKLILGYTDTDSSSGIEGAGGELTSTIITSFITPVDQNGVAYTESGLCNGEENCNFADKLGAINNGMYEPYLTFLGGNPNYDNLTKLNVNNLWETNQTIYNTNVLALVAVGIFILYQVIVLCMDAGLRLVKLGLLEMIAPVVIVSYIASGADHLSKWAKMTVQEFTSILIRIAGLCFMVLGFRLMNDPNSIFNNDSVSFWFKVFLIIGLLRMIKELPDMFGKLFGANIKMGGIKDKLGEMAGIGKMAQNAWGAMGGLAKVGAGAAAKGVGKFVKKGSRDLATDMRNLNDKRIDKWNKKHPGQDWSDTRRAKIGKAIGTAGRGLGVAAGKVPGAAKVAQAVYKDGGKDTKKALEGAVKENFGREQAEYLQGKKERKDAKMAEKINGAVSGKLEFKADANGNRNSAKEGIDFKHSMKNTNNKAVADMNNQLVDGMGRGQLSSMQMENLKKWNSKRQDYADSQRNMDLYSDLEKQLSAMEKGTKNQQQIGLLKNALNELSSGNLNVADLQKTLAQVGATSGFKLDSNGNLVVGKDGKLEISGKGESNAFSQASFAQFQSTVMAAAANANSAGIISADASKQGMTYDELETTNNEAKQKYEKQTKVIEEEKKTIKEGTEMYDTFDAIQDAMTKSYDASVIDQRSRDAEVINKAIAASKDLVDSSAATAAAAAAAAAATAAATAASAASTTNGTSGGGTSSSGSGSDSSSFGGTAKADIDTSGLEKKLDEINSSIQSGSKNVANEVRTNGDKINSNLKTANDTLNSIDKNTKEINDKM